MPCCILAYSFSTEPLSCLRFLWCSSGCLWTVYLPIVKYIAIVHCHYLLSSSLLLQFSHHFDFRIFAILHSYGFVQESWKISRLLWNFLVAIFTSLDAQSFSHLQKRMVSIFRILVQGIGMVMVCMLLGFDSVFKIFYFDWGADLEWETLSREFRMLKYLSINSTRRMIMLLFSVGTKAYMHVKLQEKLPRNALHFRDMLPRLCWRQLQNYLHHISFTRAVLSTMQW